MAISEFPKGRKYLISLSFRGKASVRPAQVGGFDVNIVIHGSTAARGRRRSCRIQMGPVEADGAVDAQNAPTAPWKTLRVFHELHRAFPSNHSRKTPKGPKIALGNPDRPIFLKWPRCGAVNLRNRARLSPFKASAGARSAGARHRFPFRERPRSEQPAVRRPQ